MEWVGANINCELKSEEEVVEYTVVYDKSSKVTHFAKEYKKLIYKNIYPNIDVEYQIDGDGCKQEYSVILWPGADLSQLRMRYSGDVKLHLNEKGELILNVRNHEIKEEVPLTFYDENKNEIKSHFVLKGNEVSFALENYDKSKKVVIDPWVNTGVTDNAVPHRIERDAAGNIYVLSYYGGMYNYKNTNALEKYNSSGALLWTYNMPMVGFCEMAVDQQGNIYYSFVGAPGKLNTNGTVIYPDLGDGGLATLFAESSQLTFNCAYTELIDGGTNSYWTSSGALVNTTTGAMSIKFDDATFSDLESELHILLIFLTKLLCFSIVADLMGF